MPTHSGPPKMTNIAGISDHLRLLSEDLIFPDQFAGASVERSREKRLMLALLEDAIKDLRKTGMVKAPRKQRKNRVAYETRKHNEFYEDAREWIDKGNVGLVTFDDVCLALDFTPEYIRRLLNTANPAALGSYRRSGWDRRERVMAA